MAKAKITVEPEAETPPAIEPTPPAALTGGAPGVSAPVASDSALKSVEERFVPQMPTVIPDPVFEPLEDPYCCGNCPGWKRVNARAPFGQCLPAIKWFGAPMYTPDLAGCTLDDKEKAKGASR